MHALRVKCPDGTKDGGTQAMTEKPGAIAARRQDSEEVVASAFDGVDTHPVALEGPNFQAQLLF